jgi:hypothetical protein
VRRRRRSEGTASFGQNHGVPGVVYILLNDGLALNYCKIGCSSRSGRVRAAELNKDANTGTPGIFRCIFEHRTLDCGRAERMVFQRLAQYRRGKRGQEFFEIDQGHAKGVVAAVCREIDALQHRTAPPRPVNAAFPKPGEASRSAGSSSAPAAMHPAPVGLVAGSGQHRPAPKPWAWGVGCLVLIFLGMTYLDRPGATVKQTSAPAQVVKPSTPPRARELPLASEVAATKPAEPRVAPEKSATSTAGLSGLPEENAPPGEARHEFSPARELTPDERQSIESVCSHAKYNLGPAAYLDCKQKHRDSVLDTEAVSLTGLSEEELSSIRSACSSAKFNAGPQAYKQCLQAQLVPLATAPRVSISNLTRDERSSIKSACSNEKHNAGPAAYNLCLQRHMQSLETQQRADLSGLNADERQSAESSCSSAKYTDGPSAYHGCLLARVAELALVERPNLSGLSADALRSISSVCSMDKYTRGPAAYRSCQARHLASLR